ncbi:hypothetical protein N474_01400 [Pseudoalteromonas luteoviolacea CPMOR-2]|uniref:Uncharacterized protein n=1 Tax=Pseudoalteromonas luteoviolacea DSM 6061 TaxID=1365250 RepID=A0A166WVB6_9GAMM|nr:hypothetical protein N475_15930 [Pseudoalteromonas luteoviolacea DSM 6061]KZN54397.1 hypothetical protein N474_01400 [Pseudoalteromonas luteoviolacea CPMOR-2]
MRGYFPVWQDNCASKLYIFKKRKALDFRFTLA